MDWLEFQAFLGTEVNWRSALPESLLETANGILAGIEFGDQVPGEEAGGAGRRHCKIEQNLGKK